MDQGINDRFIACLELGSIQVWSMREVFAQLLGYILIIFSPLSWQLQQ